MGEGRTFSTVVDMVAAFLLGAVYCWDFGIFATSSSSLRYVKCDWMVMGDAATEAVGGLVGILMVG